MMLQLLSSDNTYPKEQTGRDEPTGGASPCSWAGKTRELAEVFQTPLLEGCISLNRTNGGCSGTESHADEKSKEQTSAKDAFSCSVFFGASNSFRFLVRDFSRFEALGMAESPSAFLSGAQCCSLSRHKESRRAWRQGEGLGKGWSLQVCTQGTVSWSQYCFVSELITSDQCNGSTGLCEFICLHRADNCCFMKIASGSYSFAPN